MRTWPWDWLTWCWSAPARGTWRSSAGTGWSARREGATITPDGRSLGGQAIQDVRAVERGGRRAHPGHHGLQPGTGRGDAGADPGTTAGERLGGIDRRKARMSRPAMAADTEAAAISSAIACCPYGGRRHRLRFPMVLDDVSLGQQQLMLILMPLASTSSSRMFSTRSARCCPKTNRWFFGKPSTVQHPPGQAVPLHQQNGQLVTFAFGAGHMESQNNGLLCRRRRRTTRAVRGIGPARRKRHDHNWIPRCARHDNHNNQMKRQKHQRVKEPKGQRVTCYALAFARSLRLPRHHHDRSGLRNLGDAEPDVVVIAAVDGCGTKPAGCRAVANDPPRRPRYEARTASFHLPHVAALVERAVGAVGVLELAHRRRVVRAADRCNQLLVDSWRCCPVRRQSCHCPERCCCPSGRASTPPRRPCSDRSMPPCTTHPRS